MRRFARTDRRRAGGRRASRCSYGIAFDRDGDRIEDDQADVVEALNRLCQLRHVGGRIKGPFSSALAHASDEMNYGLLAARRQKARQERVLDVVLAAPEERRGLV